MIYAVLRQHFEVLGFDLCCAEATFRRFWSFNFALLRQHLEIWEFDLCCAETTFWRFCSFNFCCAETTFCSFGVLILLCWDNILKFGSLIYAVLRQLFLMRKGFLSSVNVILF